jgi:hypothetical protein
MSSPLAPRSRLSISMSADTASIVREAEQRRDVSVTQIVRQAAALRAWLEEQQLRGNSVRTHRPDGSQAELVVDFGISRAET